MTGKTILHYRVLDRLGAGGMGEVYRAEDTRLGRVVALKFLGDSERSRPDGRRRLLAEARTASALRSPHVAVTHDIVEHEDQLFIVMEYVEGETLLARIERGALPPREAAEVALGARRDLIRVDHGHDRQLPAAHLPPSEFAELGRRQRGAKRRGLADQTHGIEAAGG